MATRKRNEWLEAEESEDEERGYDSEDESRAQLLRNSKRQKVSHDSEDEDEDHPEEDQSVSDKASFAQFDDNEDIDLEDDDEDDAELTRLKSLAASLPADKAVKLSKPLLLSSKPKKDKSGIIYLSRCPPFMKPSVLRSLLTPYGAVGRVFLTPESAAQRSQRLKGGGTRRKLFLDGWVEFLKKRDAKFVAENLNAQTMGGKKRGRWHDEVWNIKYLKGIKWNDLVEQIQNENAERQARMRTEIAQGKKENARFLEDIERGKIAKTMEERRKKKFGADGEEVADEPVGKPEGGKKNKRPKMEFRQSVVKTKGEKKPEAGQDASKVLSMIF